MYKINTHNTSGDLLMTSYIGIKCLNLSTFEGGNRRSLVGSMLGYLA